MLNPSVTLERHFLLRERSPHPNRAWQEDTRQGSKIQVSSTHTYTSHLFSQAQCLHSYKQNIHSKVLISSTCVPREINQMRRNGCVASDTSFQHSFPTCPHQRWILSDLPQLPPELCHHDLVHLTPFLSHSPLLPTLLAHPHHPPCHCPARIPSPPWARSISTPQISNFVTTGIKFSCLVVVSTWSSHASRFRSLLQSVTELLLLALALSSMLSFMPFLSLSFPFSLSATFLEVPLLKICFFSEDFHH